jgi:hypothetical protein
LTEHASCRSPIPLARCRFDFVVKAPSFPPTHANSALREGFGGALWAASRDVRKKLRDAWAQGGAKRLFGHYDNGVFVVAELAAGLH